MKTGFHKEHTTPNQNHISFWWITANLKHSMRTMKTPSHSISLNSINFSINNAAKWLLELKRTRECWSTAEVDWNTQDKAAFLLIPKVREQTQKQMQPSGSLNKELSFRALKFCSVPSPAYQQAAGSSVQQPQKDVSMHLKSDTWGQVKKSIDPHYAHINLGWDPYDKWPPL